MHCCKMFSIAKRDVPETGVRAMGTVGQLFSITTFSLATTYYYIALHVKRDLAQPGMVWACGVHPGLSGRLTLASHSEPTTPCNPSR